ncbi:MAG TPA: DEAD/DEAH box helicase, partial [Planctomycetota bacterium]|nr:DEAD/DEAH box helicase [Planctomycetota bacterium]
LALLDRRKSENDENDGAARSNGSPRRRKARRRSRASLIVVPRSLVSNWRAEVERFAPELRVLDHSTPFREKSTEPFANHDIVLTTYGILIRDIEYLKDWSFDYVILDEAQAIKNAESNASKASRLLRANHRLALSGTPIENHLGELWSLFEFLNPGMLGASSTFDRAIREAQAERSESAQLLGNALRPLILRRTKQEVAKELPERVEQTILCDLGREERRHYDEIRDYYRKSLSAAIEERGLGRAKIQILEALLRLRQTACHPGLIDPKRRDRPSSKVSLLLDKLRDVVDEGHKALVFSQFTKLLAIVRDRLAEEGVVYEYLDGRTRNRGEKVERFQSDPDCKVFLISLKAGGLGLNLTAAEYVFLLDPWWNPAVEAQAIDRAHRIGQTRNVVAYRIVARNTVEERVVELQERKRRLVEQIITADNGLVRSLAPEDLDVLLS